MDLTLVSCRMSGDGRAHPPIGPMYLMAALEQEGLTARLVDLQLEPGVHLFDVPTLVRVFAEADSEIVGISLFSDALPMVVSAIRVFTAHFGERRFVLGGPGVNALETRLLETLPAIAAVIRGEGERTLPATIRALRDGRTLDLPGVYMRDATGAIAGRPPERLAHIDAIPWPSYAQVDVSAYARMAIVTSRGCPFNCSFCEIITMWGRATAFRSEDQVLAELGATVARTGVHAFSFLDDTFTVNRKRVLRLCERIRQELPPVSWTCFSRIDTIDPELMEAMASAGCTRIFYGIDTGSELMWRSIDKRLNRDQVIRTVRQTLQHTGVLASYIWGYPDETFEDFLDTIRLALEVAELQGPHPLQTQLHFLAPGTATPIMEEHRGALRFSEDIPLEICGGHPLADFEHLNGFDLCLDELKHTPELFASYHYYDSPDLDRKLAAVRAAAARVSRILGRAVLSRSRGATLREEADRLAAETRAAEADPTSILARIQILQILQDQRVPDRLDQAPPLELAS